jgi:hypothetical protein
VVSGFYVGRKASQEGAGDSAGVMPSGDDDLKDTSVA